MKRIDKYYGLLTRSIYSTLCICVHISFSLSLLVASLMFPVLLFTKISLLSLSITLSLFHSLSLFVSSLFFALTASLSVLTCSVFILNMFSLSSLYLSPCLSISLFVEFKIMCSTPGNVCVNLRFRFANKRFRFIVYCLILFPCFSLSLSLSVSVSFFARKPAYLYSITSSDEQVFSGKI